VGVTQQIVTVTGSHRPQPYTSGQCNPLATYNHLPMIIKGEPALTQEIHDIQPPPEYTEAPARPAPAHVQQPTPAAQPQYPPQPPTPNRDNLSPQQRQAQIAREYQNRCKFPSSCPLEFVQFSKPLRSTSSLRSRRPRRNHDIRYMWYRLRCPVVSDRFGVSLVS
jgi:outer membrane biosynthesis protein TonB